MYPFIETLMIRDGEIPYLRFHQERFERTRREKLQLRDHPRIEDAVSVPEDKREGLVKCRLIYGREIGKVEFLPHTPLQVSSIKLVRSESLDYSYKYVDRRALQSLYEKKGSCDDILIIAEGKITDSFFANVALWDGSHWYTPDSPLLRGTMRACLLEKGLLLECAVSEKELWDFQTVRLINALNPLDESRDIPVSAIRS
jgi:4-amino-4-deoxychorismate lyase